MKNSPRLRRFSSFFLSLFLFVFLVDCSSEDQATEETGVVDQATVEKAAGRKTTSTKESSVFKQAPSKELKADQSMEEGFEKSYSNALRSLRKKNYESAIENLMVALSLNNLEQAELSIPGRRSGPYLPHYFLGVVEFELGNCQGAMAHWNNSLAQNVIQDTDFIEVLEKDMQKCK